MAATVALLAQQLDADLFVPREEPQERSSLSRLEALPSELLWTISHLSKRSLRQLSSHLLGAHTPLPRSLLLTGDADFRLLLRILSHHPPTPTPTTPPTPQPLLSYSHTTRLVLTLQPPTPPAPIPDSYVALVDAIPHALPNLVALTLSAAGPLSLAALPRLAPLGACLTALRFSVEVPSPTPPRRGPHDEATLRYVTELCSALGHLRGLTRLRSLHIQGLDGWDVAMAVPITVAPGRGLRCSSEDAIEGAIQGAIEGALEGVTEIHPVAAQLRHLHQLRHLRLEHTVRSAPRALSAAHWLPGLQPLQHLTHLDLGRVLDGWSGAAAGALATGFPRLQSLALITTGTGSAGPALLALRQLTALTSLRLHLAPDHAASEAVVAGLRSLSALRLRRLTVRSYSAGRSLGLLLQAMAAQRTLACLHLEECFSTPAGACLRALEALAGSLSELRGLSVESDHARALFAGVGKLTGLTALGVGCHATSSYDFYEDYAWRDCMAPLAAAAGLQALSVEWRGLGALADSTILKLLPGFPRLRALELTQGEAGDELWPGGPPGRRSGGAGSLSKVLPLLGGLTHLALRGVSNATALELGGVRLLTRLERLQLDSPMPALLDPRLHDSLLPLPRSLRELRVDGARARRACVRLQPEVFVALKGAARAQACRFRVGAWA